MPYFVASTADWSTAADGIKIRQLRFSKKQGSMYIPNNVAQNYPFCILKLVVETFGHFS